MDGQVKKTVMLCTRVRAVDRDLLEAVCKRGGWNLSEGVRRAIANEAEKQGLYCVAGFVVEREGNHE